MCSALSVSSQGIALLLWSGLVGRTYACEIWCNEWTCDNNDGKCPDCALQCGSCKACWGPPPPPPNPEPSPPHPPTPPALPLDSIGQRPADYWTEGSSILTNIVIGDGPPQRLLIKGASWSGMEAKPCYFHGELQNPTVTIGPVHTHRTSEYTVVLPSQTLFPSCCFTRAGRLGCDAADQCA